MERKILNWFATGEVGSSSKAMACCIAGIPGSTCHPLDPADFNRCLKFLHAVPDARRHLYKVAALSATWAKLVNRWDEVEACFVAEVGLDWSKGGKATKTYDLMKSIGC